MSIDTPQPEVIDHQSRPMELPVEPEFHRQADEVRAPAAMPGQIQWYQGQCRLGQVMLGIEVDGATATVLQGLHQVLRQGTLLAEHEVLVEALELWQEIELDLVPLADLSEPAHEGVQLAAVIQAAEVPSLGALHLRFPVASLCTFKRIDQALPAQLVFSWSELPCELQLSSLHLDVGETAKLEVGAIVLLPESYQNAWTVSVAIPEAAGCLTAVFNYQDRTLSIVDAVATPIAPAPRLSDNGESHMQVVLDAPLSLNAGKFLGFETEGPDIGLNWDQRPVKLMHNNRQIGAGDLVRLGSGYAVYLTECGDLQQGS